MADFKLHLRCNHELYEFLLNSKMDLDSIKRNVGQSLGLNVNSFEIELYDETVNESVVLDDEYMEELNEKLPRIFIQELYGDLLPNHFSSGQFNCLALYYRKSFSSNCFL